MMDWPLEALDLAGTSSVGDCLFLMLEPDNMKDENAVAIILHDKTVVGHVPFHLAPLFSQFLKRNFNKGMVKVTGDGVNRGAGYGLESTLHGPTMCIE